MVFGAGWARVPEEGDGSCEKPALGSALASWIAGAMGIGLSPARLLLVLSLDHLLIPQPASRKHPVPLFQSTSLRISLAFSAIASD